jgi:transcriptional regulator with XRE-family HTH domain
MVKSSRSPQVGAVDQGPWFPMGQRLRNRRIQLGFRKGALAAHLGVSVPQFEEMEAGSIEMSPVLLGRLAELLKVPVLYFFEDILPGNNGAHPERPEPAPVSDEERMESLVSAFRALDRDKQQCLLAFARVLARDAVHGQTIAK